MTTETATQEASQKEENLDKQKDGRTHLFVVSGSQTLFGKVLDLRE